MNRVITISRQFGSGGRTIGKEVAARLGIPCYDSELILKIAEKSGLSKEYIESYGEHTPLLYHIALDSGELGIEKCVDIISDLYAR